MQKKIENMKMLSVILIILGLVTGICAIMIPQFVDEMTKLLIYRQGIMLGVAMSQCLIGSIISFLIK